MVRKRHHHFAATMIRNLEVGTSPSFLFARDCKDSVVDAGLDVPSWNDLSLSRPVEEAEAEPNQPKFGWQQQASRQMEKNFVSDHLWPRFDNAQRALMTSQYGPLTSAAFTPLPTSRATRIDPQPFRGMWSAETAQFFSALAKVRDQEVPLVLQGLAETAWVRRWSAILACTVTRAFALWLLDRRPVSGSDTVAPLSQ